MKNIDLIAIALLCSQFISAQSLTPTAINGTARISIKAKASLSSSVGELTLRSTAPAQNTVPATQPVNKLDESALLNVYPNPATDFISFNFQTAVKGKVIVNLLNAIGQKQAELINGSYDSGKLSERLDVSGYPGGMYVITMQYTDASGKLNTLSKKLQIL